MTTTVLINSLVTIGLALLAALIALHQAKSIVVSKARIKWTEALRTAISDYQIAMEDLRIYMANTMSIARKEPSKNALEQKLTDRHPDYLEKTLKVERLGLLIKLHLNSKKQSHKTIEDVIDSIYKDINSNKIADLNQEQIRASLDIMTIAAKELFSEQWKKSKHLFKR